MRLDIKIDDSRVRAALNEAAAKIANPEDMLRDIGGLIRRSVEKNFLATGRPDKWKKSKRVEKHGGQTLSDTARLRRSIAVAVSRDRVSVGTNVKYGAIHQFGSGEGSDQTFIAEIKAHRRKVLGRDQKSKGKKTASGVAFVRSHVRRLLMPARPFLMVQDSDWPVIEAVIKRHLLGG